jgi:hypothetical protein
MIADGEPWTMPATIDDRAILYEIARPPKDKGVRDCLQFSLKQIQW